MMESVKVATHWENNSKMIADVARLGYIQLSDHVLDCTWGLGNWWNDWRPDYTRGGILLGTDLNPTKTTCGVSVDFRKIPYDEDSFDVVVCDPPYRLCGKPDSSYDEAFGLTEYTNWKDRIQLMVDAVPECLRVASRYFMMKCQDQVVNGRKVWQTDIITRAAEEHGATKIDRLDRLYTPRKQRSQKHSHINYSTLLIFKKGRS